MIWCTPRLAEQSGAYVKLADFIRSGVHAIAEA